MNNFLKFFLSIIFSVFFINPSFSQSYKYENNPSYGPGPQSTYLSVAKRLSYENFRNIKLLHTALINFGGGEAEIDKLVDQYAEASALYFQSKVKEAAKLFKMNESAILKVAQQLAKKYKMDTSQMLLTATKTRIKNDLKMRISGKKENKSAEKFLSYASYSVKKGNDYYVRYKDATSANPVNLITAVYYFRRAKANIFKMYKVLNMDDKKRQQIFMKYKKDMADNKNHVYKHKEKKN